MKVKIEFYTDKYAANVYFDDVLQNELYNIHVILSANNIPVMCLNMEDNLLSIIKNGYENWLTKQVSEKL